MFAKEVLEEVAQWGSQKRSPHNQLDWRWVERFRELVSYDSYWWLTWAGPFTPEEQRQWDRLFILPLDEAIKAQLGALMKASRERELALAIEEQREPRLQYPAIEIEEIHRRIAAQLELDAEIHENEPNAIVRRFYHDVIERELNFLHLIQATYEGNTERFWECSRRLFPLPSEEEMVAALAIIQQFLHRGFMTPKAADVSQQLQEFLRLRLHLSLDFEKNSTYTDDKREIFMPVSRARQKLSALGTQRFFATVLRESGYDDWQVIIDPNATNARVEPGARTLFLREEQFSLDEIKHLFVHEIAGHAARCIAGERSSLGLLGIHTKNAAPTDEGVALYHERQVLALRGQKFDDLWIQLSTFMLGLASGIMTPPQTFLSLYFFVELFTLLNYCIKYPDAERQTVQKLAQNYALTQCLRKYRGVPDLAQAGVCYLEDTTHLHGLRLIERAAAEDKSVLDRLAVGVCALEDLPDLQELGITSTPQPLRKLAYAEDLDEYILSFREPGASCDKV